MRLGTGDKSHFLCLEIKPGATVAIKESYERIMKVHGRWIGALLLIGAGTFVGIDAWRDMPGR